MSVMVRRAIWLVLLVTLAWVPAANAAPLRSSSFMCDPAYENCRIPLIDLIDAETQAIDVGFWFMQDTRFSQALIRAKNRGVAVRVIFDQRSFSDPEFAYQGAEIPVQQMKDAGIPMREKIGAAGIFHNKAMIFAGLGWVEFSGVNYSSNAFVPNDPYKDYVDEVIVFTNDPSLVNSFKTRYDDLWTDTTTGSQAFRDYANVPLPLARSYPTYPFDPELNFVPLKNFATRSLDRYKAETQAIDSIMYRITDRRHTDAMIAAATRGVPVRLISEPLQYRSEGKLWHSWNIDRLYMAGLTLPPINGQPAIQIRHRKHLGLSHEKLTLLKSQHMAIVGSSNWTSPSASDQTEHNLFTTRDWVYNWSVDHFERKWNNLAGIAETEPFVPLPPDAPIGKAPADAAQNQALSVTLKWYGGPWAHRYDVYFGTSPSTLVKIVNDQELGPSETSGQVQSWAVTGLSESTTYYWKVVSRTMANLEKAGPVMSFRTIGAAAAAGSNDVVLWAANAPNKVGWNVEADTTAAGGKRLTNPDAGAPKVAAALAAPPRYFEIGFLAEANVPYRLWMRGKATNNNFNNDSVFVQFDDSVTSTGDPQWRIGTTASTTVTLEDCSGCGLSGWGWNDNATGTGALGPLVYFQHTGAHIIRVQEREDGLMLDQIILSRDNFLNSPPGVPQSDGTIYPEQNVGPMDGNAPPRVALTAPAPGASYTAPATINMAASASDMDGTISKVEFLANGTVIGTITSPPYAMSWTAGTPGVYTIGARAYDNGGAKTTASRDVYVTASSSLPADEVVLYPANAGTASGWNVVSDTTAAGGSRLQNPDAGAAKLAAPLAAPAQYFDMTFLAQAGRPYRLWMRGKATGNSFNNDSVYAQFDHAVTSTGTPTFRIGTTSGTGLQLEDCTGCGVSGWGWQNNVVATAAGTLGQLIYFDTTGPQTIRVQVREDGFGIDQIILSPNMFLTTRPGALKSDATIYPSQPGSTSRPNSPPTVDLSSPAAGGAFVVNNPVAVQAIAADSDGTVSNVEFFANGISIGVTNSSPYGVSWTPTAAGDYLLTAQATDDAGAVTTSGGRMITVRGNTAPTVALTSPATGASFIAPATVTVTADAADSDGTIASVEFFVNGSSIGGSTAAPYAATWNPSTPGDYTLTAIALDNNGAATTSASRTVSIRGNAAPSVSLTAPAAGASFIAPASWTITANAADSDGTVASVEFFVNGASAGVVTSAPYAVSYTAPANGDYLLTAAATDDRGAVTMSAARTVTVRDNTAPAVNVTSPVGGASFIMPATVTLSAAASDADGTVAGVEFFVNGVSVGTDSTAPYSVTYTPPDVGSYSVTATAVDDRGAATASAAVTFSTRLNAPPTAAVTAPAPGATINLPATVTVSASASDSDGAVVRVEFFANGTSIGVKTSTPYSLSWTPPAAGDYAITATATDDRGAATASDAVTVTVNPAPPANEEIVLYAGNATVMNGWNVVADTTAAGGSRLQNNDLGAAKLTAPLAAPAQYFEMTFNAVAGKPYRLWMRGKSTNNSYNNDSAYVQFDNSVTASGTPTFRIGTTSATGWQLEDCTGCGVSGWGWQNNVVATTAGSLGQLIYFATDGPQTIRIQVREDGLGIDQIVLSSGRYLTSAPGALKKDTTILAPMP